MDSNNENAMDWVGTSIEYKRQDQFFGQSE
jgi:hypothetical protein